MLVAVFNRVLKNQLHLLKRFSALVLHFSLFNMFSLVPMLYWFLVQLNKIMYFSINVWAALILNLCCSITQKMFHTV